MRIATAGLGLDWNKPVNGLTRWLSLAIVIAAAAWARAGEDSDASSIHVKTNTSKAEGSVSRDFRSAAADRFAAAAEGSKTRLVLKPAAGSVPSRSTEPAAAMTPIERAIRTIADCQARYEEVEDYTCTFYKRERIAGRMTPLHIMDMKARTRPQSIYFKFQQPAQGREAIYIAGRHGGKVLAHDVGFNKLLAGTLQLDPTATRAMEDCRHPITQAGIGPLLETLAKRWALELSPQESQLLFRDDMVIGPRRCTMIESTHPQRRHHFLHHKVRVYIDQEFGLPIRFEAYDWPKQPRSEPELTEEYTYMNLKLNVGLRDIDFDVANSAYSFGRL